MSKTPIITVCDFREVYDAFRNNDITSGRAAEILNEKIDSRLIAENKTMKEALQRIASFDSSTELAYYTSAEQRQIANETLKQLEDGK